MEFRLRFSLIDEPMADDFLFRNGQGRPFLKLESLTIRRPLEEALNPFIANTDTSVAIDSTVSSHI